MKPLSFRFLIFQCLNVYEVWCLKKKNWFFMGRKRFPEVEDDLNYGLILSPRLCISYRPQGFNVNWAGLGPY